jgi:hypothetical protein
MLGPDLRIRRFTPAAEKLLNLIPTDVGRPISDIKTQIDAPDLDQMLAEVIDTVSAKECEVRDKKGRWYSLPVRPYRTLENKIDGAVIVLVDVDALKRRRRCAGAPRTSSMPIDRRTSSSRCSRTSCATHWGRCTTPRARSATRTRIRRSSPARAR